MSADVLRYIVVSALCAVATLAEAAPIAYTNETTYLSALDAMGFVWIYESFEDDEAWGVARSPQTQQAVTNLFVRWTSNNDFSELTTSTGPALTGDWGFYSLPHGSYTTGTNCHIPGNCGDGFKGTSTEPLYAVSAWVEGFYESKLTLFLDSDYLNPVEFPEVCDTNGENCVDYGILTPAHKFFAVIDVDGFQTFEFTEMEGTAGDQKFIWSDDVTVGFSNPPPALVRSIVASNNHAVLMLKDLAINAQYDVERTLSLVSNDWTQDVSFVASATYTNQPTSISNSWTNVFYRVSGQ